jgi:hypothetical protein
MKTYFVRTRTDQALVGIFCAASPKALASIIELMVEPEDCEYLTLKANEGLFAEAQFVHAPAQENGKGATVFLTNSAEDAMLNQDAVVMDDDEEDSLRGQVHAGSPLERAMQEVIPPILEPTEALMDRLQLEEPRGWVALTATAARASAPIAPQTRTPILMFNARGRMH